MAKSGQSGRKIGRKLKSPAQKRYTATKRWNENKNKAEDRHDKRMSAKADKRERWAKRGNTEAARAECRVITGRSLFTS